VEKVGEERGERREKSSLDRSYCRVSSMIMLKKSRSKDSVGWRKTKYQKRANSLGELSELEAPPNPASRKQRARQLAGSNEGRGKIRHSPELVIGLDLSDRHPEARKNGQSRLERRRKRENETHHS